MKSDAYLPPRAAVRDLDPRRGVSHWFVIPAGVLLACATVFVAEPMLVDLLMGQFAPAIHGRDQMLAVDLALGFCSLLGVLLAMVALARAPKARASLVAALSVAAVMLLLDATPNNHLPGWYEAFSFIGVALAWLLSAIYSRRRSGVARLDGIANDVIKVQGR